MPAQEYLGHIPVRDTSLKRQRRTAFSFACASGLYRDSLWSLSNLFLRSRLAALRAPKPGASRLAAPLGHRLLSSYHSSEPDPEIQDILRGSEGPNFGLEYLPGALAFDPAVDAALVSPDDAADIVWLDAFVTNVDRTSRNTNMLVCGEDLDGPFKLK